MIGRNASEGSRRVCVCPEHIDEVTANDRNSRGNVAGRNPFCYNNLLLPCHRLLRPKKMFVCSGLPSKAAVVTKSS